MFLFFFFSSRRRHTRLTCDWSSDVCSSDLEKADAIVAQRLAQPFRGDANDVLYQWESSDDYNPSPGLERIRAALVAINADDDERNPPELGILEREIKRVKDGRYVLIPASGDTRGHGTTGNAALWKQHLADLLQRAPRTGK